MDEILSDIMDVQDQITALMLELQDASEEFHEDIEDDIRRCMDKIADLEDEMRTYKENCLELSERHAEFERMV